MLSSHGSGTCAKCLVSAGYCSRRSGQVSEEDERRKDIDASHLPPLPQASGRVRPVVREAGTPAFEKAEHGGNDGGTQRTSSEITPVPTQRDQKVNREGDANDRSP